MKSRILRIVLIIVLTLVVAGGALGGYYLMRTFVKDGSQKPSTTQPTPKLVVVDPPEKLVAEYAKLPTMWQGTYSAKSPSIVAADINYTSEGLTVSISPIQSVSVEETKSGTKSPTQEINTFLTSKKLTKLPAVDTYSYLTINYYDSANVICSHNTYTISGRPKTYALFCGLKSNVQNMVKEVKQYAKLAKKDIAPQNSKVVVKKIHDGDKHLAIVYVTVDKTVEQHYFAALKEQWEYIGNIPFVYTEDEKAAPAIPAATKANLEKRSSAYGDFLTKHIP